MRFNVLAESGDSALIALVQQRSDLSDRAFERLVDRYSGLIAGAVVRASTVVTGGRAQGTDLDVARNGARLALWAAALEFDLTRPEPFAAFAIPHVRGAAVRELRRALDLPLNGGARPIGMDYTPDIATVATAVMPSADETAFPRPFGRLHSSVKRLPQPAKGLLFEIYFVGATVGEIAATRCVRPQTVSAQHVRALRDVRAAFKDFS